MPALSSECLGSFDCYCCLGFGCGRWLGAFFHLRAFLPLFHLRAFLLCFMSAVYSPALTCPSLPSDAHRNNHRPRGRIPLHAHARPAHAHAPQAHRLLCLRVVYASQPRTDLCHAGAAYACFSVLALWSPTRLALRSPPRVALRSRTVLALRSRTVLAVRPHLPLRRRPLALWPAPRLPDDTLCPVRLWAPAAATAGGAGGRDVA
jgi:hypothetical protein